MCGNIEWNIYLLQQPGTLSEIHRLSVILHHGLSCIPPSLYERPVILGDTTPYIVRKRFSTDYRLLWYVHIPFCSTELPLCIYFIYSVHIVLYVCLCLGLSQLNLSILQKKKDLKGCFMFCLDVDYVPSELLRVAGQKV